MSREKLMSSISNIDDKYLTEAANYKPNKVIKFKSWKVIGTLAACLGLAASVGVYQYTYNYKVDSVVGIDVNPSIELELSKSEKVLSVEALNEDAKLVLEGLELEGMKLDAVVDDIMESMVDNGYVDELSYSVNVCVKNENEERGNELGNKVTEKITELLDNKDFIGTVNSQTCKDDAELLEAAKNLGVSVGKYLLAEKVTEATGMTKEEASKLSIGELFDLSDAEQVEFITKEEALAIACEHAGVDKDAVEVTENKIKALGEAYAYSVKFVVDETMMYKYAIDATNGTVLKYECEEKKEIENIEDEKNQVEELETETDNGEVQKQDKEKSETEVKLLSKKEVLEIICKDAGVDKKNVRIDELKVEGVETVTYYIELYVGKTYYQYIINAVDGTIIDKKVEEPQEKTEEDKKEEVKPQEIITKEEALSIALTDAGVDKEVTSSLKVCFKNMRNEVKYIIYFYVERTIYEYVIDGTTGDILDKKEIVIPDMGIKPQQGEKPEQGENQKPEMPTRPEQGEMETPEMPTRPEEGEKEIPEIPTRPEEGEKETPEIPTRPEQGEMETPEMPTRLEWGENQGGNQKPEMPTFSQWGDGEIETPEMPQQGNRPQMNGGFEQVVMTSQIVTQPETDEVVNEEETTTQVADKPMQSECPQMGMMPEQNQRPEMGERPEYNNQGQEQYQDQNQIPNMGQGPSKGQRPGMGLLPGQVELPEIETLPEVEEESTAMWAR